MHASSAHKAITQDAVVAAEPTMDTPHTPTSLPYFQGKYDAIANARTNFFGHLKSESGNSGVAFSTPVKSEERVVATVYVNDVTASQYKPSVQALIAGKQDNRPTVDKLRVLIRGAVLNGLGGIGGFTGIKSDASAEDQAAAIAGLREVNPKLASIIEIHGGRVDVTAGEKLNFINSISIPVKELPAAIRDFNEANNGKGNPHAGSHRVAEVLEAAMRLFESTKAIPNLGVTEPIAVSRYQGRAAAAGAAQVDDQPPI